MEPKNKYNVLLTEPIHEDAMQLLRKYTDFRIMDRVIKENLKKQIESVDILLNKTDIVKIDKEILNRAKNLKLIARHGSGYDNVDIEAATKKNIIVTYTPGVNANSVAEFTFGLILNSTRNIIDAYDAVRAKKPERLKFKGMELYGKTLGIIGVGNIGKRVYELGLAFGMKILAYHPRPSAKRLKNLKLKLVNLDYLLRNSDVITIHARLTDETRYMIKEKEFSKMKKSAILVNMARGEIVDEGALYKALKERKIRKAAIDVVIDEPIKPNNKLYELDNIIITPHIGSMTEEAQRQTAMTAVKDIIRFIKGEVPLNVVNPEVLKNT